MEQPNETRSVLTDEQVRKMFSGHFDGTLNWYRREAKNWERWAWGLQIGVLAMSSTVTIVAAFPSPPESKLQPLLKWAVVLISALTTLLSGMLSKSGIERTAQLREEGRLKLHIFKEKAKVELTKIEMSKEQHIAYHQKSIDITEEVERQFGVNPLVASRVSSTPHQNEQF